MKASNCLTRCLHHWEKYGGQIIYDSNHASVINSGRHYNDHAEMGSNLADIKTYGIDYFLSAHSGFLNNEEIEILKRYFEL